MRPGSEVNHPGKDLPKRMHNVSDRKDRYRQSRKENLSKASGCAESAGRKLKINNPDLHFVPLHIHPTVF